MATFEGPAALDQIRQRPRPLHRLDHRPRSQPARSAGTASWLPACSIGSLPKLFWNKPLHSTRSSPTYHFWVGTLGILIYVGVDVDLGHHPGPHAGSSDTAEGGTILTYRQFRRNAVLNIRQQMMYVARIFGGGLYLDRLAASWPTISSKPSAMRSVPSMVSIEVFVENDRHAGNGSSARPEPTWVSARLIFNPPVVLSAARHDLFACAMALRRCRTSASRCSASVLLRHDARRHRRRLCSTSRSPGHAKMGRLSTTASSSTPRLSPCSPLIAVLPLVASTSSRSCSSPRR